MRLTLQGSMSSTSMVQLAMGSQLWPNNGSSLADKVDRLDKNMTENNSEVRIVKELVMIMVQSHQEAAEKKPRSKKSLKSVN